MPYLCSNSSCHASSLNAYHGRTSCFYRVYVTSNIGGNFKDVKVKKQVARDFNLQQYTYLESWIKCAVVLRNACAHHARIWNKRFPTMPTMPQRLPESWVTINSFRPNKLYHQLCYLAYMEQSIMPNSDFTKALVKLLEDNPDIQTRSMGFPSGNWQDEPLWNDQQ